MMFCNFEIKFDVVFMVVLYPEQKEERRLNQSFLFYLLLLEKINWVLFYKEGKNDERNKECACQNANACKVFLYHAVIGIEFSWHGGCCRTSCGSSVFLIHFFS